MSLRIHAPAKTPPTPGAAAGEAFGAQSTPATSVDYDDYLSRLVKLVPAESIAAYPLLSTLAQEQTGDWALILVAWLLLAVTIILRWRATRLGAGSAADTPQWPAIAIAACSFIIWVNVMGGQFGVTALLSISGLEASATWLGGAKSFLAVVALVVWTILVPALYTGSESARADA